MAYILFDYTYDLLFTYLPLKRFLLSLIVTVKTINKCLNRLVISEKNII